MKSIKIKYLPILAAFILTASYFSCSHETDVPDGPNLIDRFGPFMVVDSLSVNRDSVEFSQNQNVVFEAGFNKNVNWLLEIKGTESGAIKRIEGFSRTLDASNAIWRGGTTELPFFRNESCEIVLTVPEESDYSDSAQVVVSSTKSYEGSLFMDFEGPNADQRIEIGNFEFDFNIDSTGIRSFIPAAQGEQYLSLLGTDNVLPQGFFVGLIVLNKIDSLESVDLPTTVPENLYFNCFLHSDGRPYTIAVFQFIVDSNDSGQFEDGQDELFAVDGDFPIDWTGWRQISHPMTDAGMTQEQLEKLIGIRVLLISDNNAQPDPKESVYFAVDYITFTQGQPLQL